MQSIRELIRNIDQLPSMPSVITELIELTSNPDADLDEILALIEKDQALTAKLLKLCNSSYYGLSRQVSSLRNAVVLLGFKTVYKMVIALGTSVFFKKENKGYGLSGIEMWRHSLGSAIAAEIVANGFSPEKAPAAYTAGLFHDIGKLVLSEYVENELDSILKLVESGKTFIEAEQEIIGMDHGLIGGKLARQWKLPNQLVEAIKYHHEPHLATSDKDLTAFTHIGNIVSNAICMGLGVDSFSNSLSQKVFKEYKLDISAMEDIMQVAAKQIQDAEALITNLVEETA
jgi:putative nucleotidyltransferase with HDIG domain